jgi:hypothetical protein
MNKKIVLPIIAILLVFVIILSYSIMNREAVVPTDQVTTGDATLTPTITSPAVTQAPTVTPTLTTIPDEQTSLYPAFKNINNKKLYGYINGSGAFVIQPEYDNAYDFNDGVAVVVEDTRYKIIDTSGAVIFENDYIIHSFCNEAALFESYQDNKILCGYVDTKGQVIVAPQYIIADDFGEDGQAFVSTAVGEFALIDKTGTIIESYQIDKKDDYIYDIDDGFILYNASGSNKMGVVTVKGVNVFEPIYSGISYLGKGLFAMKDPKLESYEAPDAPAAIFNQEGKQITDYTLYDVSTFKGDYFSATDSTSTFFVGIDGKEVTTLPKYEGRGSLTLEEDMVKAELDNDLLYSNKNGATFWKSDTTIALSSGITVNKIKYKPLRTTLVYYPQVVGFADVSIQDKVNSKLKDIFTEARAKLTPEDMLSVQDDFQAELINNLLIINMTGYDYYAGAAHGMPLRNYYFIDVVTGDFYELSDLFKVDIDYKTKLNELITADIAKQSETEGSMFFPDSFVGISDLQPFFLTKDTLTIYFYPYDIAPYAAGFPEFTIPLADISDYLDTNGAFWSSFH